MATQGIVSKTPVFHISVIIPAYNSERFIADAIRSIKDQTLSVDEIICVDDASTDDTSKIVKKHFPDVKLIRLEKNSGPSCARNVAIKSAKGNVIAFLDADDLWPSNKVEYLTRQWLQHEEAVIIGGMALKFTDDHPSRLNQELYFNFYTSAFLVKKSVFQEIGYFDESMRFSEDQDWFFRAREAKIKIIVYNKLSLLVRIHENNTTKDLNTSQIGLTQALLKSMTRRRKTGLNQNLSEINILNE